MAIYAMSDIHGMYESFMRRIRQLNNLETVKSGNDKLILLGDYIDLGNNSFKLLKTIYELQQEIGSENMIVLMGNHDKWFIDFLEGKYYEWIYGNGSFALLEQFLEIEQIEELNRIINKADSDINKSDIIVEYIRECITAKHGKLLSWYKQLPLYYKSESQIFVHAGVDEEAGDWWEIGTSEEMFTEKYPPTKGEFYMDIISGHVSTATVSGDRDNHDIFFDGKSHYFIDGIDSYPGMVQDDDRVIPLLVCEYDNGFIKYYSLKEDGECRIIKVTSKR